MEIISSTNKINTISTCWFCDDIARSFNGIHYGLCSTCYYDRYYIPRKKKIVTKFRDFILRYIQLHYLLIIKQNKKLS